MSITDVQRSFARGLDGKGACKTAAIDMEDGGRRQRLSFHVVGPTGAAYLSESIPIDMSSNLNISCGSNALSIGIRGENNSVGQICAFYTAQSVDYQFYTAGLLRLNLTAGGHILLPSGLVNAANDGAAAAGGVPVTGLYRNGSVVMFRVS